MKNTFLPFQIGEHYENWEFDLEIVDDERIKGFDSYIYIREIVFLDIIPRYTELIFSLDILQIVTMIFDFNSLAEQNLFKRKIEETDLFYKQYFGEFTIEISYGNSKYLETIYK